MMNTQAHASVSSPPQRGPISLDHHAPLKSIVVSLLCGLAVLVMMALPLRTLCAGENPNPWEKVDDDDGITVWARAVPGSNIHEVKAVALIDVKAERIWEVLGNTSEYMEFMPYLVAIKRLGSHPKGHYEYQLIDPPLVDERDYTVKVNISADVKKGVYTRQWNTAVNKGPKPNDNAVRVTINKGYWQIKKSGQNTSKVTYYLYTDPGGSIPEWMANKANRTSVPALMNAIRNRSKDPKWKP